MNTLNAALLKLTSLILAPFASLPAQVALIVISALAGILAAIAFRYTSPQTRLKRVADEVRASLLAIRLFRDDLRAVFAAQGMLFKASALRLIYSLPPLIVLIVPFVLLLAQLAMWYEFKPLTPGQYVLLEVQVRPDAWETYQNLELAELPDVIADGPVRDAASHTLTWRLTPHDRPEEVSQLELIFLLGDREVARKQLVISPDDATDRLLFVSPRRPGPSLEDRLLYPGEPAFDSANPVQTINIRYAARTNTLFGHPVHWLVTFFVVSILGAFAVKPIIKVQF